MSLIPRLAGTFADVQQRMRAYRLAFRSPALARGKRRAYQMVFRSPAGALVLEDLARICHAHTPAWSADAHELARNEGMRLVWLRIMQHLELTPEELFALYGGRYPLKQPGE